MESLADEFGDGAVYLMPNTSSNALAAALESLRVAPRREPVWTSWRSTAETFLSSLGDIPHRSVREGVV